MFNRFEGAASISRAALNKEKNSGRPCLSLTLEFGLLGSQSTTDLIDLWNARGSSVQVVLTPVAMQLSLEGAEFVEAVKELEDEDDD